MSSITLETDQKALFGLLTSAVYNLAYYQRPYVWTKKQVLETADDLWAVIQRDRAFHFFGMVMTTNSKQARQDLIDGQQRLTTLSLLLARLDARLDLSSDVQSRVRSALGHGCPRVVPSESAANAMLEKLLGGSIPPARAAQGAHARALRAAAAKLDDWVVSRDFEGLEDKFTSLVLDGAVFAHVHEPDRAMAEEWFRTQNTRGSGSLAPEDLVKLTLQQGISETDAETIDELWSEIRNALDAAGLPFEPYLKAYASAKLVGGLDELDPCTAPFEVAKNSSSTSSLEVAKDIRDHVSDYIHLCADERPSGGPHPNLQNIRLIGGKRYRAHLPPLLAASKLDRESFTSVARQIELHVASYQLAGMFPEKHRVALFEAARQLRQFTAQSGTKLASDVALFESTMVRLRRQLLSGSLQLYLTNLDFWEDGKPQQRGLVVYLLGRLEQEQSLPEDGEVTEPVKDFLNRVGLTTVEHILPQQPTAADAITGDQRRTVIGALGNLTLLTPADNARAGTSPFDAKKAIYVESDSALTVDVVAMGDTWDHDAFTRRSEALTTQLSLLLTE